MVDVMSVINIDFPTSFVELRVSRILIRVSFVDDVNNCIFIPLVIVIL